MEKEQLTHGATHFDKGDITIGAQWLVEAKTCMQPKSSFSIKEEQYACSKMYSTLCFDFGDQKERYYIIDENMFLYIKELIEKDEV